MTYAEVSTQIRGYIRKWRTGWGIARVDEAYELMSLEQFYKLCHSNLKSWLTDKDTREVCLAGKLWTVDLGVIENLIVM